MLGNGVYLSQACLRALDHLWSVGALACPTFGFYARLQVPLARTRAVGPRVRDLYVGVAPDLCVSRDFECPMFFVKYNKQGRGEKVRLSACFDALK